MYGYILCDLIVAPYPHSIRSCVKSDVEPTQAGGCVISTLNSIEIKLVTSYR